MRQRTTLLVAPKSRDSFFNEISFSETQLRIPGNVSRNDRIIIPTADFPVQQEMYIELKREEIDSLWETNSPFGLSAQFPSSSGERVFNLLYDKEVPDSSIDFGSSRIVFDPNYTISQSLLGIIPNSFEDLRFENLANLKIIIGETEVHIYTTWNNLGSFVIEPHSQEIGIFYPDEKLTNLDNISLSGVRIKSHQGRFESPKKTEFQIIPQNRFLPLSASMEIVKPAGLHPVLKVMTSCVVESPLKMTENGTEKDLCKLYYMTKIPRDFFIDRYQFESQRAALMQLFGETNLELPTYKIDQWGSLSLFQINATNMTDFEIPLHLRYPQPGESGYVNVNLPTGELFWSCDIGEKDADVMRRNPFNGISPEIKSVLGDAKAFYHFRNSQTHVELCVPRAVSDDSEWMNWTVVAILATSVWYLMVKLLK